MQTFNPVESEPTVPTDERHLQQLQRMAMVGTLAAGLGHDLRNLLMPVMLRLDVLAASRDLSDEVRADVAGIRVSVSRLQRLSSGLRLLASDPHDQRNEVQTLHLATWWGDVQPLVVDALAPHTRLAVSIPTELPPVSVPPGVLAQVLMNLVLNARRAMHDCATPEISFTASRVDDRHVCFEIRDNGAGMDEEARMRCFEPFFTTRPREYATGLGLSTGRSLLHRYGGDLRLGPALASGVAFHIILVARPDAPAYDGTLPNGTAPAVARSPRVRIALRDPRQRTVALLMLSQRGLQPWTDTANDAPVPPPATVICDGDTLDAVLSELSSRGLRDQTRIIAVGHRPSPSNDGREDIAWVAPSRLGTLADLLD